MNAVFRTFLALIRLPGYPGISLAMFLSGVASSFAVPYTSLFGATEAHMTPVRLGIFMTLTAVSSVIVSTFLGRIADRRSDKKRIVLLSIAGSALGYALLCVTRNYVLLTIFGCVFLSIGAAVFPQLFTFGKARLHSEGIENTELPMATLRTTLSCAWVFGPAVGAIVLGALGFNGLFLSAAGAFVVAGVIMSLLREPKAYDPLEATDIDSSEIPPQAKNARVYAALVSFTLIGMGSAIATIMLPVLIVDQLHGTTKHVAQMVGLGAFAEIPMMLMLGGAARRINKANMIAWASMSHILYFAGIALAPNLWVLVPLQILNAVVVAVTSCLGMSYFQELMPGALARATTLFFNTMRTGSVLAGVASGFVAATWGYRAVFVFCVLLASSASLILFAFNYQRGKGVFIEQEGALAQEAGDASASVNAS
jgi:MFS transporter, SET family, sugar efflux transporter